MSASAAPPLPSLSSSPSPPAAPLPWWRVNAMVFFVAALGSVVAGSFVLLALALVHGDTVDPAAAMAATRAAGPDTGAVPALQARNHAATPAAR